MASRKGELKVNVISAKGLRDTAIFGIQDPYVQLVYGSLKVKTAVHRDGGTSPVWNESIKLHTAKDSPTKLVVKVKNAHTLHDNRVGTTEVDLSDVFANKHEEVSAPLFTRDGRQKGEVQLAFTFHPFGQSPHGFQHGPNPSDGAASEASPQVSPQVSPHKPGHKAEGQGTGLRAEGAPEPAPPSPSLDESLGPLGQSFMNLAMSHISPSKANSSSRALDEHAYLQLGTRHEGISESPSAPTGQTHSAAPGQPSSSGVPTASPQQRNFYPEEASDDESDMPSQHSRRTSAAGASGSALPPEFKCQQPSNSSIVSAADETVDQASYSSQEVYHAYRTRDCNGRETNGLLPLPQYGAYMVDASPSGHGNEPQPQVPAWRLLGTSPLREGQMQHLEQPQVQQALPGQQYQPPRQSYSQPAPGQGIPQQAYGQGHQLLPQRPEWHLMGGPTSHSGPVVGDIAHGSTSQSFTVQGRGPSYASLAVGSWTDGVNQSRPFARPAVSQTGVQGSPSAPRLPMIGRDSQSIASTSSSQAFAGFSHVSQSHDSTHVASHGRLTGRPPSRSRARTHVVNPGMRSLPFSDLGQFALSTNHDRHAVI